MAGAALVAALGPELDHAQLGPALVRDDPRGHGNARQPRAVDHISTVHQKKRLQRNGLAVTNRQAFHDQGLPLLDAVLLATCSDDRVGHSEVLTDSALAPER